MSFDTGSVSFRMVYARGLDAERLIEGAVEKSLPDLEYVGADMAVGWAGPAHLMDRDFTQPVNGLVRLNLVRAERKFPAARLKAEISREILAEMKAQLRTYINKKRRSEIKDEVMERLLPEAPVGLDGIEMVYDKVNQVIYTTAMSDSKYDALYCGLRLASGYAALGCMDADTAARVEHDVNVRDLKPMKSGFGGQQEMFDFQTAREFLTWLWMVSETGGVIDVDGKSLSVMLEGPLVLAHPDGSTSATERVTVKGDRATMGEESLRALNDGKLLKSAKLAFVIGEKVWSFSADADGWLFKGMKLPPNESFDAGGRLQERMELLNEFRGLWLAAFAMFIRQRVDHAADLDDLIENWQTKKILTLDTQFTRKTEKVMKALDRKQGAGSKEQGPAVVSAARAVKAFAKTVEAGASVEISSGGKGVKISKDKSGRVTVEKVVGADGSDETGKQGR